jgi:hypothetical protein
MKVSGLSCVCKVANMKFDGRRTLTPTTIILPSVTTSVIPRSRFRTILRHLFLLLIVISLHWFVLLIHDWLLNVGNLRRAVGVVAVYHHFDFRKQISSMAFK